MIKFMAVDDLGSSTSAITPGCKWPPESRFDSRHRLAESSLMLLEEIAGRTGLAQ